MKSEYKIHKDQNLIEASFQGDLTPEEMIAHVDRVNADPEFQPGMSSIINLTGAHIDWQYRDMDQFRMYLKRLEKIRGECKWALICPGGVTASTAKLMIVIYEAWSAMIQIRMFSNDADGRKWIESEE